MGRLQDVPAFAQVDAGEVVAESDLDLELPDHVAGHAREVERRAELGEALAEAAVADQDQPGGVAGVRTQRRVAGRVSGTRRLVDQREQPLLIALRRAGAPARLTAQQQQDDRPREQPLCVLVRLPGR